MVEAPQEKAHEKKISGKDRSQRQRERLIREKSSKYGRFRNYRFPLSEQPRKQVQLVRVYEIRKVRVRRRGRALQSRIHVFGKAVLIS